MKIYILLLTIFLFGFDAYSQKPPPPFPGESASDRDKRIKEAEKSHKADEKKAKEKAKLEAKEAGKAQKLAAEQAQNQREQRLRDQEADMEKVALFPNDYKDKTLRFRSAQIGRIGTDSDGKDTIYSVWVESVAGKSYIDGISANQGINFILSEDLARSLTDFYSANGRSEYTKFIVDLTVETKMLIDGNNKFFFANIKCIEFSNRKTLGVCE